MPLALVLLHDRLVLGLNLCAQALRPLGRHLMAIHMHGVA